MKTLVFHTGLRQQVKPLLEVDTAAVYRLSVTTNSEGDPSGTRTLAATVKGTVTEATESEQLIAAERGTRVDKVFCSVLGLNIQGGDFLLIGGVSFEVVMIDQRRLYQRVAMRYEF